MIRSTLSNATQLRANRPLTDIEMKRVAPSIYAPAAHQSRSDRYAYVPTSEILTGLAKEGFQPFFAAQSRTRVEGKQQFTKHLIRLRHAAMIPQSEAHEVIIINSHDGSSAYHMAAGMIRFVCLNGLVCGDSVQSVKVAHFGGNVTEKVIQGAYTILDQSQLVSASVDRMKFLLLTEPEQSAFAEAALTLRYDAPAEGMPNTAPIAASRLLRVRRAEDAAPTLWNTFNRTQEALVGGGLAGQTSTGRRTMTRPVEGIAENTKLNRALWMLAERMAELKSAAAA